jgi:hypothetical protein
VRPNRISMNARELRCNRYQSANQSNPHSMQALKTSKNFKKKARHNNSKHREHIQQLNQKVDLIFAVRETETRKFVHQLQASTYHQGMGEATKNENMRNCAFLSVSHTFILYFCCFVVLVVALLFTESTQHISQ